MIDSPFLIVVSGLPASGKSTLARQLHKALQLPLLDKDDIQAPFVNHLNPSTLEQKRLLSTSADEALLTLAKKLHQGIVCSFWHHPGSTIAPGTPAQWMRLITGKVLEIYCHCSAATALERLTIRQQIAAIGEAVKSPPAGALAEYNIQIDLGPLGLTDSITVDTEQPVNLQHLIPKIRQFLETH
ncbi:MAG: ATP-binding protein [Gammaproteobacteria bacterium]|nr:ATP-binding protein [Gammaproteobacteria bacterium]